jgi:two-component system alkaline phosphatase synthesis response regulator PhoP
MVKKILVVDDETDLTELVSKWLTSKGYDVLVANDGSEGLRLAKESEPTLIILDIKMPGMDGFEVLDKLRAETDTRFTPVIMLTQKRETESMLKAQNHGTTDYIMKPFSVEELLRVVKRYDWYNG